MPNNSSNRSIGLLTGTFDPIHLGHVELAMAAMRECGLDEIWLMVNPKRSDSPVERKNGVLEYSRRMAMAKLATMNRPGVVVYDGVLADRPHTMTTFRELMRQYSEDRFVFIVGMDTIGRLDRWDDFESIVNNTSFAVAKRPGPVSGTIGDLKIRLGHLGDELDVQLFEFEDYAAATSTETRRQLRARLRPDSLDNRVEEYILSHGLYL